MKIRNVVFTSAKPEEAQTGLIGWVSAIIDESLTIDGIAVRRMRSGRLSLSFPARRNGRGRKFYYFRPLHDKARKEVERQVFSSLGFREGSA